MDREQLLSQWREEAARGMSGWDFSHIQGRCTVEPLPWDYPQVVREFLRPGVRLLDMGTGGGELLLTLGHPYELTSVTEGWEPNLALCQKKLAPLGITVKYYDSEKEMPLPFPDDSFDLVIDRHESYDLSEVRRVLKKNGFFVTQQVGGENDLPSPVPPGGLPGDAQRPGLRGKPLFGRGRRGVPGQHVPLGVPGLFRGNQPRGVVSDAGAGGVPGLCAQPGAPLPHRGEK